MSRSFEFRVESTSPPAVVHAALTNPEQWMARFKRAEKSDGYELTPHPDGGLTVFITEEVGTKALPAIVKKVIKGEMRINRTDYWGPLVGDHCEGTLTGGSTGVPTSVQGALTLSPSGDGSVIVLSGETTVKIPLIGSKIEGLVQDMVGQLITDETKETQEWIDQQG